MRKYGTKAGGLSDNGRKRGSTQNQDHWECEGDFSATWKWWIWIQRILIAEAYICE